MTYPTFNDFKKLLKNSDLEKILYFHLIEGTPYIFKDHSKRYQLFRKAISSALDIPMKNIAIVGSARIGFSLNPNNFGRPFTQNSDIDTVVVSPELFDTAWIELIRLRTKWYSLTPNERSMVKNHKKLVYWGNIRPDKLPGTTQISKLWLETFRGLGKIDAFASREVNGFLFRTWWQVESYYMFGLKILRTKSSES